LVVLQQTLTARQTMQIRDLLTAREWSVYELRKQGFSLRQIAHRLDLSISTVRSTLERIDRKLGKEKAA
jgi:DNA-binding NarL/FixJ family response regulator